jgi:hypothetical protein
LTGVDSVALEVRLRRPLPIFEKILEVGDGRLVIVLLGRYSSLRKFVAASGLLNSPFRNPVSGSAPAVLADTVEILARHLRRRSPRRSSLVHPAVIVSGVAASICCSAYNGREAAPDREGCPCFRGVLRARSGYQGRWCMAGSSPACSRVGQSSHPGAWCRIRGHS